MSMGTQKIVLVEFFTDSHSNYLNNIYISKQQGKNTSQWETQAIDFCKLMNYNFKLDITIDNSHIPVVLSLLSLSS